MNNKCKFARGCPAYESLRRKERARLGISPFQLSLELTGFDMEDACAREGFPCYSSPHVGEEAMEQAAELANKISPETTVNTSHVKSVTYASEEAESRSQVTAAMNFGFGGFT